MFDTTMARLLDALADTERVKARAEAEQMRLLAEIQELRAGTHLEEFTTDEVAAHMRWSTRTAQNRIDDAMSIVTRLPGTLAALERGAIDRIKAAAINDVTAKLSVEHAGVVETQVLEKAPEVVVSTLRGHLRKHVAMIDPDGAQRRHRERAQGRKVWVVAEEDGMATLSCYTTAAAAEACYRRIMELARKAKTEGDERTEPQRQADVFQDALCGKDFEHVQVVLTLTGSTEEPSVVELDGHGPLTPDAATELLSQATVIRKVATTPTKNNKPLNRKARCYRPPPDLVEHVRSRDKTCRFPGCHRKAERCDLDHTTPFHQHGDTVPENLGPLCRHHHRLKQQQGWTLLQPKPGVFVWQTPTGTTITIEPDTQQQPDPIPSPGGSHDPPN
ncbi:uncharacterized protein DUF222 [Herbihabitans rhizosphaerae]|uniref:Uncharacterized protein DUF222 n=1 Tax=Herbihabitans rhizosphaerae TaxID=1872711 RepID=A0A4Q7KG79_9PSEU|nr:HNH endonuclease signature motif containing protein [Herbihabitans rhizosphaerae]RZS34242.1 uncharacterized protein DUF222 [Herbihabitans rhizosphaerae]